MSGQEVIVSGLISCDHGDILISAERDSVSGNAVWYFGATVVVDQPARKVVIDAPLVSYNDETRTITSGSGRLRILNKPDEPTIPEADFLFKGITVTLRDDAVGLTVIVRELGQ